MRTSNKSKYFPSLIDMSHNFVQRMLQAGNASVQPTYTIDGTAGNGHDTLFLAELAGGRGRVFAYDIQKKALEATRAILSLAGLERRVTLFTHGHEQIKEDLLHYFQSDCPKPMIHAAMFNFGFLPKSDKTCVTQAQTSLTALDGLLPWMRPSGGLSLHLYTGHEGGEKEAQALEAWATALSWKQYRVMRHEFANKAKNREILLLIEVLEL